MITIFTYIMAESSDNAQKYTHKYVYNYGLKLYNIQYTIHV